MHGPGLAFLLLTPVAVLCVSVVCSDRLIACEVSRLSGVPVLQIAGGWRHTMALDQEGNVWAWGWNKFGQLGENIQQSG